MSNNNSDYTEESHLNSYCARFNANIVESTSDRDCLKICIIEDSSDDFEWYQRLLPTNKYIVKDWFRSAEDALEKLAHSENCAYDILLVDYSLPKINGLKFIELIREHNIVPDVPILLITGCGSEEIAIQSMKMRVSDYLIKSQLNTSLLQQTIENSIAVFNRKKQQKLVQRELQLFAHTIAHDLKSPLNRIHAYAQQLVKKNVNDKYAQNIFEDTEFLQNFVDKLLEYTTYGRNVTDIKKVDLNKVISQSIRNLEPCIKAKKVNIMVQKHLPFIIGSEISLIQLFQNLISNSIKYSDKQPLIEIRAQTEEHKHVIKVIDNGIGIPQPEIENIFRPFYRLDGNEDGTGLGLALVKIIAQQHSATITVTSEIRQGTEFNISFVKENIDD